MNIFILNTGRCGSTTFVKACSHITNYTSAHESRCGRIGEARLNYPDQHIEADNRLSWFLGRLDQRFGNRAMYVHLKRNEKDTALSFLKRFSFGIMKAYKEGVLLGLPDETDHLQIALDYYQTVNKNIEHFLKDKKHKMDFDLENAAEDFKRFWDFVGAEGDQAAAIKEFDTAYNASEMT